MSNNTDILVLGATGFIGSRICNELAKVDIDFVTVNRHLTNIDFDALSAEITVINCVFDRGPIAPKDDFSIKIVRMLLNLRKKINFIHISSIDAYMSESLFSFQNIPDTSYGLRKYAVDNYLTHLFNDGKLGKLQIVVPGLVLGNGGTWNAIFEKHIAITDASAKISTIDVEILAREIVNLTAFKNVSGFYIPKHESVTINSVSTSYTCYSLSKYRIAKSAQKLNMPMIGTLLIFSKICWKLKIRFIGNFSQLHTLRLHLLKFPETNYFHAF